VLLVCGSLVHIEGALDEHFAIALDRECADPFGAVALDLAAQITDLALWCEGPVANLEDALRAHSEDTLTKPWDDHTATQHAACGDDLDHDAFALILVAAHASVADGSGESFLHCLSFSECKNSP